MARAARRSVSCPRRCAMPVRALVWPWAPARVARAATVGASSPTSDRSAWIPVSRPVPRAVSSPSASVTSPPRRGRSSRQASPAWVVAAGQWGTLTRPPATRAAARKGPALDRSGSITTSPPRGRPGWTRQVRSPSPAPGAGSSTAMPRSRSVATVMATCVSEGTGPVGVSSRPPGRMAPRSRRAETNWEEAEPSTATRAPSARRRAPSPGPTRKGRKPGSPRWVTSAPRVASASSRGAMGRRRAASSPSKTTGASARAARAGTKRMTVPARPTSMRPRPSGPACTCSGRGAGVTRRCVPVSSRSSKRAPSTLRAASMSSVSRERRRPVSVVGASASAASSRARALSDFDPGSSTIASSAPAATGARHGSADPAEPAERAVGPPAPGALVMPRPR